MHTHSVCLIWFKAYTTVWLIPQTLSKKSPVIDLFCYVYFNKRLLFYLFHKVKNSSIGGGWAWNVTVNNNTDTHSLNNWLVGNTMDEHKLKLAELKESYTPEEWSCSSHMDWHSYKQVRLTDSQRRRVMGKGRFHYISAPARSIPVRHSSRAGFSTSASALLALSHHLFPRPSGTQTHGHILIHS